MGENFLCAFHEAITIDFSILDSYHSWLPVDHSIYYYIVSTSLAHN
jgi:hypothetical protein